MIRPPCIFWAVSLVHSMSPAGSFFFDEDGFYLAQLDITPKHEAQFLDQWRQVIIELSTTYGDPLSNRLTFDKPYEEGDGYETYSFKNGLAHAMCMWAIGSKVEDLGTITVAIDDGLGTLITYSNGDRSVESR